MTEDQVEQEALKILAEMSWTVLNGPEIGPDGTREREYIEVFLNERLASALKKLNPAISQAGLDSARSLISRSTLPTLYDDSHQFHNFLVNGLDIEKRDKNGEIRTETDW